MARRDSSSPRAAGRCGRILKRTAAPPDRGDGGNPDDAIRDIRFDAILVAPGRLPRHIPAVFETS